jgi:hypothetical protein
MAKTYVIYYGWLMADSSGEPNTIARTIASAYVPLLIAQYHTAAPRIHVNLSRAVLSLMHSTGTRVYAYVATRWGRADLRRTSARVEAYLRNGADGIFFDEADPSPSARNFHYYQRLANQVWDKGASVILNAGVSQCGEALMRLTDTLMVEHAWRNLAASCPWTQRYDRDRFMGVSSNESDILGYTVDERHAIRDTHEAWQAGIGWHTSTNRYVELPHWFPEYVRAVKRGPRLDCTSNNKTG